MLEKFFNVAATGEQTLIDAGRGARTFGASMQLLSNNWQEFADGNLAEPVADLAEAIGSVEPEQFQRWMEARQGIWR